MVESRYQIEPNKDGFIVKGIDRHTVQVQWGGRYWHVSDLDSPYADEMVLVALNFPMLLSSIGYRLMLGWKTNGKSFAGIRNWAVRQTTKALNKKIYPLWKERIDQIPTIRLNALKAMYADTFSDHELLWTFPFYRNKYLYSDFMKYRACRHAFAIQSQYGFGNLEQWRSIFVNKDDSSYPALNRTLDRLPGNIKYDDLRFLRHVHLKRSIERRSELLITVIGSWNRTYEINKDIYMFAQHEEIVRGMQMASRYFHRELSTRRRNDIDQYSLLLRDYPEKHNGNIVGLTEKTIDWHRAIAQREIEKELALFQDETPVALPPLQLPEIEGVRFLNTVGKIKREGMEMGHCIGAYAPRAKEGYSYLFSIEYKGERASVEVDRSGKVVQAYGNHNRTNSASQWGSRVLNKWGKGFPEDQLTYTENTPIEF